MKTLHFLANWKIQDVLEEQNQTINLTMSRLEDHIISTLSSSVESRIAILDIEYI